MAGILSKTLQVEQVAARLRERLPTPHHEKADHKAASLLRGFFWGLAGAFCLLASGALVVIPVVAIHEMPGVPLLVFSAGFGIMGLYFMIRASVNTSGEALDELKALGGVAGMVAKLVRGKRPV